MVTIIIFCSDFQVKWGTSLLKTILLGPSSSWEKLLLSFSFLWNLPTTSCHLRNSQNKNALDNNAVLQNKIVMPLPVWWFHLWNLNLWKMTDGAVRAMPPVISWGYCYSSVLHILSEAGMGIDLLMPWYLHTEIAKDTVYFCPCFSIWFTSGKKWVPRLSTTENKLINIKIFNMFPKQYFTFFIQ